MDTESTNHFYFEARGRIADGRDFYVIEVFRSGLEARARFMFVASAEELIIESGVDPSDAATIRSAVASTNPKLWPYHRPFIGTA